MIPTQAAKILLSIVLAPAALCAAAEVVIDDFEDVELERWAMSANVWREGKGHRIGDEPCSLRRVTDPQTVSKDRAGLRVEFASGKAKDHPHCYGLLRRTHVPRPAQETDCLTFWIHKEAGGGDIKGVSLFNATSWRQFSAGPIRLDFDGWKRVVLKRDELRRSHDGMRWADINYLQFVVRGDFAIVISGMRWTPSDAVTAEGPVTDATRAKQIPYTDVTPGEQGRDAGDGVIRLFSRNVLERCTYKTTPRPNEKLTQLSVFGSPGEYEPVTFSVRSSQTRPQVRVELANGLRSDTGVIPASAVDVRVVAPMSRWLDTRRLQKIEYLLVKRSTVDLSADRTTRFWITVKIPDDAKPGTYSSDLVIKQDERVLAELAYEVEVLPIRLAQLHDINYFMYFRQENLPKWGQTKEYYEKCLLDMKEHGINGITAYVYPQGGPVMATTRPGWLSMDDTLAAIEKTGLLGRDGKFIWLAAACYGGPTLRKFTEEVQKRRYEMVFYAIDEPGSERRNKQVRAVVPRMRKACPNVSITTAIGPKGIETVGDYYDTWICAISAIDDARMAEAKAKNKRLWSYECALAPTDALTCRHYFGYLLWRTRATGAAFWAYCDGSARDRFRLSVRDWDDYDERHMMTHDFVWCVPEGPIPSIGWEAAREGIDDYRYVRTLELLIADAGKTGAARPAQKLLSGLRERINPENYGKALSAVRERSKKEGRHDIALFDRGQTEPSMSRSDYDAIRRQIVDQILRLQDVLGRTGQ